MHVEVPKAHSLKEFGREYLMIVVSIVTALALEHGVQTMHHRHLAHEAALRVDEEMQANVHELDKVLAHNKAEAGKLKTLRDQMQAALLEKEKNHNGPKLLLDAKVGLNIMAPTLRREAWEVAVSSQAASWMQQKELETYSSVYANMRDLQTSIGGSSNSLLNGPALLDVLSNYEIGEGDPKALYRVLKQMIATYDSLDENLQTVRDGLAKAASQSH